MATKKTMKKVVKKTVKKTAKNISSPDSVDTSRDGKKPIMPKRGKVPTPQRVRDLTVVSKKERPLTIIEESRKERKRLIRGSSVPSAGALDVCPIHNRTHVHPVQFEEHDRDVYQCMRCGLVLGNVVGSSKQLLKPMKPKVGSG